MATVVCEWIVSLLMATSGYRFRGTYANLSCGKEVDIGAYRPIYPSTRCIGHFLCHGTHGGSRIGEESLLFLGDLGGTPFRSKHSVQITSFKVIVLAIGRAENRDHSLPTMGEWCGGA